MTEVCTQVATEPELQPVSQEEFSLSRGNVQDGTRLDIAMNGFLGRRAERAFIDAHVFNSFGPFNAASSLSVSYKKHENIKKRAYGQWICEIEHATVWLCQPLMDWLTRQLTFINTLLLYCLISRGMNTHGLVKMFLVLFLVTISYSMCLWCLFLDSTLCCGSSTNGFGERGVQFIFRG